MDGRRGRFPWEQKMQTIFFISLSSFFISHFILKKMDFDGEYMEWTNPMDVLGYLLLWIRGISVFFFAPIGFEQGWAFAIMIPIFYFWMINKIIDEGHIKSRDED